MLDASRLPASLPLAPGPRGHWLWGSLKEFADARTRVDAVSGFFRDHGDVVRVRLGPKTNYMVFHPDHVKYVLVDNPKNLPKSRDYDKMKAFLGNGLLTSEGEFWRRQRRLMQPPFHLKTIGKLADTMATATAQAMDRWAVIATAGEPVEVAAEMMRLTLRVAGLTLFSTDVEGEADKVGRDLPIALAHVNGRIMSPFPIPEWLPTPGNLAFRRARRELDGIVYGLIEQRRQDEREHLDLLALLLAARDEESNAGMDDRQLRDEAMTIILAGHETTANALAWAFYRLTAEPEVVERLEAEVDRVLGGRSPTFEDVARLRYTGMVIDEVLRLYPPAWFIERQTIAEDTIGGYRVPKDTEVGLVPYVTHRHPAFWDDPEAFDPERMAPERAEGRHRFAYFPFGGGARVCIGNHFALLEAKIILAMVIQRFRWHRADAEPVHPAPMVTLRPDRPIWMRLERR